MTEPPVHRRKKIEIVCERAILDEVVDWLRAAGVTGHTVVPHVAGHGRQGRRDGDEASRVLENALVIAITREDVARRLLNESVERWRDFTAIVYLSDVEVARPDHF